MRTIDGGLSQIAAVEDRQAIVTHEDGRDYRLECPAGTILFGLGDSQGEAHKAIRAWRRTLVLPQR